MDIIAELNGIADKLELVGITLEARSGPDDPLGLADEVSTLETLAEKLDSITYEIAQREGG